MVFIWGAPSATPERRRHSHETQAGRGAAPSNLNTSLTPGTAAQTNQQQARTRAGENIRDGGALADHSSSETDLPTSQSTNGRYANSAHSLPFRRTHTRMGSTTVLFLFSILLLLHPQPSSPSSIGLNLVDTLRRKLLQVAKTYTTKTPDDTHLKLCETDLCDSRRPDGPLGQGLCDRWARGEKGKCPDEQIFHVQGDPGTNDKAEMFFNLRSPWDVKCEKVLCLPLCRCACAHALARCCATTAGAVYVCGVDFCGGAHSFVVHVCCRSGEVCTGNRIRVQRLRGGGVHSGARLHLGNARHVRPGVKASQDLSSEVCVDELCMPVFARQK